MFPIPIPIDTPSSVCMMNHPPLCRCLEVKSRYRSSPSDITQQVVGRSEIVVNVSYTYSHWYSIICENRYETIRLNDLKMCPKRKMGYRKNI